MKVCVLEALQETCAIGMLAGRHTYPLFIQFHELLCDLGSVEGQAQALDIELRDHVLQHFLQGQPSGCRVLCRGGNGIFQDGTSQCHELKGRHVLW